MEFIICKVKDGGIVGDSMVKGYWGKGKLIFHMTDSTKVSFLKKYLWVVDNRNSRNW